MATVTGAAGASQPPRAANQPAHGAGAPHRQIGDSAKISLLATPALGCIQSLSERWKP